MKVKIGSFNLLYPTLVTIVGSAVRNKPTFTTITHVGIMDLQTLSISVRKEHFINEGIGKTNSYSVNIPSVDMIREVDLCGHISGRDYDKSVNFETFYNISKNMPLIKQCHVNMECQVTHTIELSNNITYVGKILATHCDSEMLKNRKADLEKIQPILFSMQDYGYWNLNRRFAEAGFPFKNIVDKYLEEEYEKAIKEA